MVTDRFWWRRVTTKLLRRAEPPWSSYARSGLNNTCTPSSHKSTTQEGGLLLNDCFIPSYICASPRSCKRGIFQVANCAHFKRHSMYIPERVAHPCVSTRNMYSNLAYAYHCSSNSCSHYGNPSDAECVSRHCSSLPSPSSASSWLARYRSRFQHQRSPCASKKSH